MSSSQALPDDVLLEVLAAADPPTAARMMAVSRFLYSEGPKVVLRRPVCVCYDRELTLFLAFLLAQGPRRLGFVRGLDATFGHWTNMETFQRFLTALDGMSNLRFLSIAIRTPRLLVSLVHTLNMRGDVLYGALQALALDLDDLDARAAKLLVDALPRMRHLRTLTISDSDSPLESDPALLPAFAAITTLDSLRMPYIGEKGLALLRNTQSRLASIDVEFLHPDGTGDTYFDRADNPDLVALHPVELLSHLQASLEELDALGWSTDVLESPDPDLVYPKMRRLDLKTASLPLSISYIRAYPNLAEFRYRTGEGDSTGWGRDSETLRAYNARQRVNVLEQLVSGRTWTRLQKFCGSLVDLYLLGLVCPIESIDLNDIHDDVRYQFDIVLGYAQPRHLRFSGWPRDPRGPAEDVFAVFRGEGGSRLESLRFSATLDSGDEDVDFQAIMESLKSSLSSASLRELTMDIRLTGLDKRPLEDGADIMTRQISHLPPPPPFDHNDYLMCPAEVSAHDFDLVRYMHSLAESIALRNAEFTLTGPRNRKRTAVLALGSGCAVNDSWQDGF